MKLNGARKQTLFLTVVNGIVRAVGLLMRVLLSRMLGAEIMGIMELAQSVHMVAITPLTSGLPAAITRLTVKVDKKHQFLPLFSGLWIARLLSAVLIPLLWFFSKPIANLVGDARVLPSLWFTAPCILILGYSAAYNGFCYGADRALLPSVSELIEQLSRFAFTFALLYLCRHLTAAWMAAIPVASTMLAELAGLFFVVRCLRIPVKSNDSNVSFRRDIFQLAYPTTLSRLMQTALRSLTAILIPLQLQRSGLSAAEATARLGMLNGMVMPILMLPCIFTSALSMVALPKIAKAEEQPSEMRRLLLLCTSSCMPFSALCGAGIYLCAPLLAVKVYQLPELSELFRLCAPMTWLMSLQHLAGSILSALGQQKRALYASSIVSVVTLALTWLWAADPTLRITGVVWAQYSGSLLSLLLSCLILHKWRRERKHAFRPDDRFA